MDTFACDNEQCCNADRHSHIDSLKLPIAKCSILVYARFVLMSIPTIGLSLAGTNMLLNAMPRKEAAM